MELKFDQARAEGAIRRASEKDWAAFFENLRQNFYIQLRGTQNPLEVQASVKAVDAVEAIFARTINKPETNEKKA